MTAAESTAAAPWPLELAAGLVHRLTRDRHRIAGQGTPPDRLQPGRRASWRERVLLLRRPTDLVVRLIHDEESGFF